MGLIKECFRAILTRDIKNFNKKQSKTEHSQEPITKEKYQSSSLSIDNTKQ